MDNRSQRERQIRAFDGREVCAHDSREKTGALAQAGCNMRYVVGRDAAVYANTGLQGAVQLAFNQPRLHLARELLTFGDQFDAVGIAYVVGNGHGQRLARLRQRSQKSFVVANDRGHAGLRCVANRRVRLPAYRNCNGIGSRQRSRAASGSLAPA
jgi:hypothetical protein